MAYNGHKNWSHWNVALWFGNDVGLYHLAKDLIKQEGSRDRAAESLYSLLAGTCTPDGAVYNKTNIRAALRGIS